MTTETSIPASIASTATNATTPSPIPGGGGVPAVAIQPPTPLSPGMNSVACVAVVGKQNNPLYIRVFREHEDKLKFHYVVHTSLDVVDERVASSGKNDPYLGLLFPTEESKVYGYATCTKAKFILVLDDVDVRESHIKTFFRKLHSIFADAISNPFYTQDLRITSKKFDSEVEAACVVFRTL